MALRPDGSTVWSWSLGANDGGVLGLPVVGPDALYVPLACPSPSSEAPQGVCAGAVVALDLSTGMARWYEGAPVGTYWTTLAAGASALYAVVGTMQGGTFGSELVAIGE